jgi:uncharacterized protein YkwD
MAYFIKSALSEKFLTVHAKSKDNGAGIVQYDFTGDGSQQWNLEEVSSGTYKIRNLGSGKVIDVPRSTQEPDTQLVQFDDNGGNNQLWKTGTISDVPDAIYFTNIATAQNIDVRARSVNNQAPIIQYPHPANKVDKNQQWFLQEIRSSSDSNSNSSNDNFREMLLARLINEYRQQNGLVSIPISKSLSDVARFHVKDLFENRPDQGSDGRGYKCNLHSWSDRGNWSAVCYTDDNKYKEKMWNKPREITNNTYTGNGYEIAAYSSGQISAEQALSIWKNSPPHNDVILERNIWANKGWPAFGVSLYGNYAVAWFGDSPDN